MYSKYVYGSIIIPFTNIIIRWYLQICLRTKVFCVFKISTAIPNTEVIYHDYIRNNAYSKVSEFWVVLFFETELIIEQLR